MGIHKLLSFVKSVSELHFPQFESKENIYISNVIYFDMTYKLIEVYNQFMKTEDLNNYGSVSSESDESVLNRLFAFVAKELSNLFSKLINYNRAIYVFVDYVVPDAVIDFNLLFKDFVNDKVGKRERINYIPMVKREYVKYLEDGENMALQQGGEVFNYIAQSVRCMMEVSSIKCKLAGQSIEEWISIPCLLKRNAQNTEMMKKLNYLMNVGRFRYLVLRGAKLMTKRKRGNRMFGFFEKDEWAEGNINATLANVLKKGDLEKVKKYNHYIPFSLVLYALPLIVSMIKTKGVYYLGCEVESDFAIAKHVRAYSKHCFPTIYTTDTDLLVLLSDVDCIVKMNGGNIRKPYLINPVVFWRHLFGCDLSPKVIKIMCVLLGSDYNPFHQDSPIHIKHFKEVLGWLGVKNYNEIDEDLLLVKICMKMNEHKESRFVQQTAAAMNIYLNDIEKKLHYINNVEPCEIDAIGFLRHFRNNWFTQLR